MPVLVLYLSAAAVLVHHFVDFLHVVGEALQEHPGELGVVLHHALADILAYGEQV